MVQPSQPDLEVVGAFNPAVTRYNGEVLLLLRVAEAPPPAAGKVAAPVCNVATDTLDSKIWARDVKGVGTSDP